MDDKQFPDIFTDSINVTAGPFGYVLTLYLSEPAARGSEQQIRTVGRVRLSPELARALADTLEKAVATAQAPAGSGAEVR